MLNRVRIGFTAILCIAAPASWAQPLDNSVKCKELAIEAAQWAKDAYEYAKITSFEQNAFTYADSSVYCLKQSVVYLDSCIALATDSDFLAVSFARMSKEFASKAEANLIYYKQAKRYKREYGFDATSHCTQAVIDAYHASFYFEDASKNKKEPEPVATTEPAKATERQITKLDVDQTLFALLNEQLQEKTEKDKDEIKKLEDKIKKTKDLAQLKQLKEKLKKLESQEIKLEKKNVETSEQLSKINGMIDERNKNAAQIQNEETVFAKGLPKGNDQWNKQVLTIADLPQGLVYQVQIGVYKSAIEPAIFKGLTPIFKTEMPGGILYSTGVFEKLTDAQEAKAYVKSIGLADAFITAYHDRKKITLAEAAKLEKK